MIVRQRLRGTVFLEVTEGDLVLGEDGRTVAVMPVERTSRCLVVLVLPIGRRAKEGRTALMSPDCALV